MKTEHLVISQVAIDFPTPDGPFRALYDVNLVIDKGEFISIIGHSGCGKSTVLNIVAGLYQATEGGVILDGREVNEPGPDRAVVFQNHSLLPWLTAYENVELAVKQVFKRKKSKQEIREWIEHNLELVHMSHAMHKRPGEISGGMKQRVGIARALAMEPKVLLMDEPFGALDALTRTHMQDSLMEIHQSLRNTVIMITHDVDEAVLLSDRIVMMSNGPAATVGDILSIDIERPRNRLKLADDPLYNHYRAEVVRFLHERHTLPADSTEDNKASGVVPEKDKAAVLDLKGYRNKRGQKLEKCSVKLGFVPLTDCAPLVIAKEKGFFQKHGLDVTLSRESTWANIRDKVCYGVLDGAQMLPGIPLSTVENSKCRPMVVSMALGLNGNGITISTELWNKIHELAGSDISSPLESARALKMLIERNKLENLPPLDFGVVFPESSHNFLLRYWLASADIDPDKDVNIKIIPPPQMVSHMQAGLIAGYCVGEPWNVKAEHDGIGRLIVPSSQIWNNHPEKVFGCTREWAESNPNTHASIVAALIESCVWLDEETNRAEASDILSRGKYVNVEREVIEQSFTEKYGNNIFFRYAANYPWYSDGLWTLTQMARWGYFTSPVNLSHIADAVYLTDVYQRAAGELELPVPANKHKTRRQHAQSWNYSDADCSIAMSPNLFMDGKAFDPLRPISYIDGFTIKSDIFDVLGFRQVNEEAADSEVTDDSQAV